MRAARPPTAPGAAQREATPSVATPTPAADGGPMKLTVLFAEERTRRYRERIIRDLSARNRSLKFILFLHFRHSPIFAIKKPMLAFLQNIDRYDDSFLHQLIHY